MYLFYKNIKKNDIYSNILKFPKEYFFGKEKIKEIQNNEPIYQTIENFLKENKLANPISTITVSLSGGVDSMVILSTLIKLRQIYYFRLVAVHVNYNQRKESNQEEQFVENYCIENNVELKIKRIENMVRKNGTIKRNMFENESRTIRLDGYKYFQEKYQSKGVFLGHHKDDLAENIFINSLRGRNILDLEVMKTVGSNYNFIFYRPLLTHFKKEIFEFAHKYDIPYLLDTTPMWSHRGIMRNVIFRLLDNILGFKWKEKLLKLGFESRQLNQVVLDKIIKPWLKLVEYEYNYESKQYIIKIPIYHVDKDILWSILIKKIFYNIEINTLKDKTINRILQHINNCSENMITLDKGRIGKIEDNKFIIHLTT